MKRVKKLLSSIALGALFGFSAVAWVTGIVLTFQGLESLQSASEIAKNGSNGYLSIPLAAVSLLFMAITYFIAIWNIRKSSWPRFCFGLSFAIAIASSTMLITNGSALAAGFLLMWLIPALWGWGIGNLFKG